MQTRDQGQAFNAGGKMVTDALIGALAGAAGVWVMDRVDWFVFNREAAKTRARTYAARPDGLDPGHVIANRVASLAGKDLTPAQPNRAGLVVHYNLGIIPGALYGVLHDRAPMIGAGRGLLYGTGLALVQDEAIVASAGLSGPLTKYPWQAHARGLLAHLVYGVVLDAGVRTLKQVAHRQLT